MPVKESLTLCFAVESITDDLIKELDPMVMAHWIEVGNPSRQPNVVWNAYKKAEEIGILKIFTVRDTGRLVGYGFFIISPSYHHGGEIEAMQDVFFLQKKYRMGRAGIEFLKFCDDCLRSIGVVLIRHQVTPLNDWGNVLLRIGYEKAETNFVRRF